MCATAGLSSSAPAYTQRRLSGLFRTTPCVGCIALAPVVPSRLAPCRPRRKGQALRLAPCTPRTAPRTMAR